MLSRTQISDIAFILKANITLFDSDYDAIKVLVDALIKARLEAKENDVRLLSGQIDETKNSKLQLIAEAMRHVVLKEKPTTENLGYTISEFSEKDLKNIPTNENEKILLKNVLSNIDIIDYVFATTHYDECSNGFFFRRS